MRRGKIENVKAEHFSKGHWQSFAMLRSRRCTLENAHLYYVLDMFYRCIYILNMVIKKSTFYVRMAQFCTSIDLL